ncbi:MAG: glycosyltransferase family 2 protein, partial [Firmicutes bacterium]|nr:glycosyltransferase family 2 protein [Bacillota bacterium]MDY5856281.1 glycosyltransferase family 2 protein [Anaerovoracaceae bacterium]
MDDKISIIIPVYNTSSYLGKAIESTLNQTYQNIEIIIIDDGSTDGSDAICDEYASKYSNISVIHSPNQGVSAARSKGIERATGDYVMFVDSDDWIEDTICDVLLSAMHKYRAESAMCGYVREYPSNSLPKYIFNENRVMSGTEIQQILCGPLSEQLKAPENIDCLNCIPFKLYPLHAVKKAKMIDIKEVGTAEDLLFNLDAFGHISSCVYVNKPLYHYRKNVETSITTAYKPDLPEKWNRLFEKIK